MVYKVAPCGSAAATVSFYRCNSCAVLFDPEAHADPQSYLADEDVQPFLPLKFYVEGGASLTRCAWLASLLDAHFGFRLGVTDAARYAKKILEIGSSVGFFVDVARWEGWQSEGIEPSPAFLRWGQEHLTPFLHQGFLETVSAQLGRYDAAVGSEVVEHVREPRAFLQSLRDTLNSDGLAILTTPNCEAKELRWLSDNRSLLGPGDHVILYSARRLEELLREAGFHSVWVHQFGGRFATQHLLAVASPGRDQNFAPLKQAVFQGEGQPEVLRAAQSYLRDVRARCGTKAPEVARALACRELECLCNLQRYEEAVEVGRWIEAGLVEQSFTLEVLAAKVRELSRHPEVDAYIRELPGYAGDFCFAYGIALMATKQPGNAERYFACAQQVFTLLERLPYPILLCYTSKAFLAALNRAQANWQTRQPGKVMVLLLPWLLRTRTAREVARTIATCLGGAAYRRLRRITRPLPPSPPGEDS